MVILDWPSVIYIEVSHKFHCVCNPQQTNPMNASSESLPPPPAYLLDSSGRTSPGKANETHVTQTVKGKQPNFTITKWLFQNM